MDRTEDMEQVTEMVMTPANAMSPLHCDGCMTYTRPRHHAPDMDGDLPCNDGHCLSEGTSILATVTKSFQLESLKAVFFSTGIAYQELLNDTVRTEWNDNVLAQASHARTVVLRE